MAEHMTHFRCSWCNRGLTSSKPIPINSRVRCPDCGKKFRVESPGDRVPVTLLTGSAGRASAPSANGTMATRATAARGLGPSWADPGSLSEPPDASVPQAMTPRSSPRPATRARCSYSQRLFDPGGAGSGRDGRVHKARHEKLKRIVALKIITINPQAAGGCYLGHFQSEAEVVARLHHPNIIQIFEVGEQAGRPYLALEFATGGTLKARLEGQPQPVRAAAQMVEILACAVHAAHLRGIVHLDLKPANILLENFAQGEDRYGVGMDRQEAAQHYGVPKVTDFGVARRMYDDFDPAHYGEVSGTPLYMAPEQIKAQAEEIGPATDVYALGSMLYEMLTGHPPFLSKTTSDVMHQVVYDPPPPPRHARPQIPRDLEAICLKCLEKEPRRHAAAPSVWPRTCNSSSTINRSGAGRPRL